MVKCIMLVFLGVLNIGIENSYIPQVRYKPHLIYLINHIWFRLSDEARCSEASWFSVTKIWYAYLCM